MIPFDSLSFPFLAISLFINITVLFFVYSYNKKSATNIIFVWLSLFISAWMVVLYVSTHMETNIYLARLSIFLAMPLSFTFFLLGHTMPSPKLLLSRKKLYWGYFLTSLVMLINLTPIAFKTVVNDQGSVSVVSGLGMLPFSVLSTFFSAGAIYCLFKKFNSSTGVEKRQISFVLVGVVLMLTLVIGTILLPVILSNDHSFLVLTPIYTFLFLLMTAIAILKYQLFHIKLITTEILVALFILILFFEALLAKSLGVILLKLLFVIFMLFLGITLIKSVKKEVEERENVQHLARSLKRANKRLQEMDRQKTEFLSIASHQLRTPLSVIKGYVELISDGAFGKITKKTQKVLTDIDININNERLVGLVDEFLDITRIEQGRTHFHFSPENINKLVISVIENLKEKAHQKGLKLIYTNPGKMDNICIDADKLREVMGNFIDNAIKYTEKGKVTVVVKEENGGVIFSVKDTGQGFGEADQDNFFQKFYRGHNVEGTNVNGTGLGLYVARKFIEAHKGKVWAKSRGLHKGSDFGFWIPRIEEHELQKQNEEAKKQDIVVQYGDKRRLVK
ncbi:hypothetical protein KKG22_04970 [Patescibacteria group bacterium]|nr:hypothetical protein [Patescibacteria group bacterium]MBU1721686.1 hypothetical protein [Patescibacteria group bacterium]MBU1900995.1 hypothetical protein [Patescibacteria group bacterium]